jgi:hypothetical protein
MKALVISVFTTAFRKLDLKHFADMSETFSLFHSGTGLNSVEKQKDAAQKTHPSALALTL